MSLHDPYQIATVGQNSRNTFTLASNGILVDVFIEDVPVTEIPDFGGGIIPGQEWPPIDDKKKKEFKRITVIATIDDKEYRETKIVQDEPNLRVQDVNVGIKQTDTQPVITISLRK